MKQLTLMDWVAVILVIVGGVNWGLVGLANFDLVAFIFGSLSLLSRIIYILVGVAAVYLAIISPTLGRKLVV